jgi:ABC-type cobalamin/Fe3+-siderophores transport system ATPase subunit
MPVLLDRHDEMLDLVRRLNREQGHTVVMMLRVLRQAERHSSKPTILATPG